MNAARNADIVRIKASIKEILDDFQKGQAILAFNSDERRERYQEVLTIAPELKPLLLGIEDIQKSRQVELTLVKNLENYLQTLENTPEGTSVPINTEELVAQYEQFKQDQKAAQEKRAQASSRNPTLQRAAQIAQQQTTATTQTASPTFSSQMSVEEAVIDIARDWITANAQKVATQVGTFEQDVLNTIRDVRGTLPIDVTPAVYQARIEERLIAKGVTPELVQAITAQIPVAIERAEKRAEVQRKYAQSAQDAAEETIEYLRRNANTSQDQAESEPEKVSPTKFAIKRIVAHFQGEDSEQAFLAETGSNITEGDSLYEEAKTISRKVAGTAITLPPDAPMEQVIRTANQAAREQIEHITDPEIKKQLITDSGDLTTKGQQVVTTIATAASGGILLAKEDAWRQETPIAVNRAVNTALDQAFVAIEQNQRASPTPSERDFETASREQHTTNYASDERSLFTMQQRNTLLPQVQEAVAQLIEEGKQPNNRYAIQPTSTATQIENILKQRLATVIEDQQTREVVIGAATAGILTSQQKFQIEPTLEVDTQRAATRTVERITTQLRENGIEVTEAQQQQFVQKAREELNKIAVQPQLQPNDVVDRVQTRVTASIVEELTGETIPQQNTTTRHDQAAQVTQQVLTQVAPALGLDQTAQQTTVQAVRQAVEQLPVTATTQEVEATIRQTLQQHTQQTPQSSQPPIVQGAIETVVAAATVATISVPPISVSKAATEAAQTINRSLGNTLTPENLQNLAVQVQDHIDHNTQQSQILQNVRDLSRQQQINPDAMAAIREAVTVAKENTEQTRTITNIATNTVRTEVENIKDRAETYAQIDDVARKQAVAAGFQLPPSESLFTPRTDNWQTARVDRELIKPLTDSSDPQTAAGIVGMLIDDKRDGRIRIPDQAEKDIKTYQELRKEYTQSVRQNSNRLTGLYSELDDAVLAGDDRKAAIIQGQIDNIKADIELKKTEALIKAQQITTDYSGIIVESVTKRADSLTDSMQRMADSGQWADDTAKQEFYAYNTQRQALKQVIEDEQKYNAKAANAARQQIVELDTKFFAKTEILDSYFDSGSIEKVQERTFALPSQLSPQEVTTWNQSVKELLEATKPSKQLNANELNEVNEKSSEWAILYRSPQYIQDLKERVARGELTYDQAIKELDQAADRTKEIHDTFHKTSTDVELIGTNKVPEDLKTVLLIRALPAIDGMYTNDAELREAAQDMTAKVRERFSLTQEQSAPLEVAYLQILKDHPNLTPEQLEKKVEETTQKLAASFYMENARLDKTIQQTGETIKKTTISAIKDSIGVTLLSTDKISTEEQAHQTLVSEIGWNAVDEIKQKRGQSFSAIKELRDFYSRDATRGAYASSYRMFATAVANDILKLHSVAEEDLQGEIRKVMIARFDEFFPEDTKIFSKDTIKKIRQNYLLQLDSAVQNIVQDDKFQQALTAAKSRESVIPLLLYGQEGAESREGLDQFLNNISNNKNISEFEGLRPLTWEERVRREIRDEYRIKIQSHLLGLNFDAETAEAVASIIVTNSFGRLTMQVKPGTDTPEWVETFGKKIKPKKFNMLELAMLEKMSVTDRKKWLDANPDKDEQIFLGMLDQGLASLSRGKFGRKLTDKQLEDLRKLLRNYYNADEASKKIFNEQISQEDITPSDLALAKASLIGNYAFLRSNYIESRIRATPSQMVNGMFRLLPQRMGTDYEYGLALLINPTTAHKQLERELRVMLQVNRLKEHAGSIQDILRSGMSIDEAIANGLLPKLSYFQKQQIRELQAKYKTLDKVSEYLSKNPKLAAMLKARADFFGNDGVQLLRDLSTSDDPLNLTFSYGSRYLINKAKLTMFPKLFKFDPATRRVVFNPLHQRIELMRENARYQREKFFRWVLNTGPGKAVKNAIVNGIIAPIKKLISKLPGWLLSFITQTAIPFIGTALNLIWKVLGIGPLKYIRDAIVLIITSIVGRLLYFIYQIAMAVIQIGAAIGQLFVGGAAAFSGMGAWFSKIFAPTFGSTAPLQLSLPTGTASSVMVSNGFQIFLNSAGKVFSTILNLNFSSFFASIGSSINVFAGFAKALFLGGWPGAYTYIALLGTSITVITFQAAVMDALKDGPEELTGRVSEIEINTNPVSIIKTADSNSKNVNDTINYTITVKTPACDSPLTITDTLPADVTFVGQSNDPLTPPASAIVFEGPDSNRVIKWTITIDNPQGPCSKTMGVGGSLTDTSATVEDIRQMLRQKPNSPLNNPAYGDSAQAIYAAAQEVKINPLAMIGIFNAENGLGTLGIAEPFTPGVGGCFNLGGIVNCPLINNQRLGTQTCQTKGDPNPWCRFDNYSDAIRANFEVVRRNVYDRGQDTVEKLANTYIPIEDPRPRLNGVDQYDNCPKFPPFLPAGTLRVEADDPTSPFPGDTESCIVPGGKNPQWKWIVANAIQNKLITPMTLADYRQFRLGNSNTTPTNQITITLNYQVTVNSNIVNSKGETNKGCVINLAKASIGTGVSLLSNQTQFVVGVGGEKCTFGVDLPSSDPEVIREILCNTYRVCTTVAVGANSPKVQTSWNIEQLTALWMVVQKIEASPTYKNHTIDNRGIEIQRQDCYMWQNETKTCDDTQGYHNGTGSGFNSPGLNQFKLITITDSIQNINPAYLIESYEYLFSHEIGHAASTSDKNGNDTPRDTNPAYKAINECKTPVSTYGQTYESENNADALALYMTDFERLYKKYLGQKEELADDFGCVYRAAQEGFFGGTQYVQP